MTKQEAAKVKVGETILNKHCRRPETVCKIITKHPDPKARLPMFVTIMPGECHSHGRRGSSYLLFKRV